MYKEKFKKMFRTRFKNVDLFAVDFVNFNGSASEYSTENNMFLTLDGMINFLNALIDYLANDVGIKIRLYKNYKKEYCFIGEYVLEASKINILKKGKNNDKNK